MRNRGLFDSYNDDMCLLIRRHLKEVKMSDPPGANHNKSVMSFVRPWKIFIINNYYHVLIKHYRQVKAEASFLRWVLGLSAHLDRG